MTTRGRPRTIGFVALLVVIGLVVPLSPSAVGQAATPAPEEVNQTSPSTPTPIVPHEVPDVEDEEGDLEPIEHWLEFRLYSLLNASIHALEDGRYGESREALNGAYADRLDRLSEVYIETGDSTDPVTEFERTRRLQEQLIDQVVAFHDTRRRYVEAKQAGDAAGARRLERQAKREANATIATQQQLVGSYRALDNQTAPQYFRPTRAADGVRINMLVDRRQIASGANATTLSITEVRRAGGGPGSQNSIVVTDGRFTASFVEPLTIVGQLWTRNGEPVDHETVDVRVGHRVLETRTNWNGTFSLTYRPVRRAPGQRLIEIRYVPAVNEPYLPSSTSLPVRIEPARPTMSMDVRPETVRAGENVSVEGDVTAERVGVEGVPVAVSFDGTQVGTARTDRNGTFRLAVPIQETDPAGGITVESRTATDGWAVAPTATTASFRIAETETSLTATGTLVNEERLDVSGRLTARSGRPIGNATVVVTAGDTQVGSARTGPEGEFAVSIDRRDLPGSTPPIAVRYRASENNFAASSTEVRLADRAPAGPGVFAVFQVSGPGSDGSATSGGDLDSRSMLAIVLGGTLLIAFGALLTRRRGDEAVAVSPDESPRVTGTPLQRAGIDPERLLRFADDRLQAGDTNSAVLAAYAAVRQPEAIGDTSDRGMTHWEFYRDLATNGLGPEDVEALRTITRRSELAAFRPGALPRNQAAEAVSLSRDLVGAN